MFNIFQAKTTCQFLYNRVNMKFLAQQMVKVDPSSETMLNNMLSVHPAFKSISPLWSTLVPRINQIRMVPPPPHHMNREAIENELIWYGLSFNPYAVDEVLQYQLNIARSVSKKTFITILNERGQPVYLDDINKLKCPIDELKVGFEQTVKEKRDNINFEITKNEIKIVSGQEYLEDKEEFANSDIKEGENHTISAIERDIAVTEYAARQGMDLSDFIKMNMDKSFNLDPNKKIPETDIDTNIPTEEDVIKTEVKTIRKKKVLIDFADITYEKFSYLIEPKLSDSIYFCKKELDDKIRYEIKEVDWRYIPLQVMDRIMIVYNLSILDQLAKCNNDRKIYRYETVKMLRDMYEKQDTNKMAIELNLLMMRFNEIEKMAPYLNTMSDTMLKKTISLLKNYGCIFKYPKDMKYMSLKHLTNKVLELAKLGCVIPETETEINFRLKDFAYNIDRNKHKKKESGEEVESDDVKAFEQIASTLGEVVENEEEMDTNSGDLENLGRDEKGLLKV